MGVQTPQIEPKADWLSLDDLFHPRTIEIEMNTMSDVCFVNKWIQLDVIRCLMLVDVLCESWMVEFLVVSATTSLYERDCFVWYWQCRWC